MTVEYQYYIRIYEYNIYNFLLISNSVETGFFI